MPDAIEMIIEPRERDLGGFTVRRLLPLATRRNVGPFVFFDHLGPAVLPAGKGIDVRSHPHTTLDVMCCSPTLPTIILTTSAITLWG